jgi:hypothetical protein
MHAYNQNKLAHCTLIDADPPATPSQGNMDISEDGVSREKASNLTFPFSFLKFHRVKKVMDDCSSHGWGNF